MQAFAQIGMLRVVTSRRLAGMMISSAVILCATTAGASGIDAEERCYHEKTASRARLDLCLQYAKRAMATGLEGEFETFQKRVSRCREIYHKRFGGWHKKPRFSGSSCHVGDYPRFTDSGATVTDNFTGLVWEKKTSLDGLPNPFDPHDADNSYSWSGGLPYTNANGTVFTEFLSVLNSSPCFAGECDWRLPTTEELQTILSEPNYMCSSNPCVYAALGSTQSALYQTASSLGSKVSCCRSPNLVYQVSFYSGEINWNPKSSSAYVRAVRGGP